MTAPAHSHADGTCPVTGASGANPHAHCPPQASDSRSPCPALNTLANHGYLPRDGRGLTPRAVVAALTAVYRVSTPVAAFITYGSLHLLGQGYGAFALHDLAAHNKVEHDASLVHADAAPGALFAPTAVSPALLADFLRASADGRVLTPEDVARVRVRREAAAPLTFHRAEIARSEIATVLCVFNNPDAALHAQGVPPRPRGALARFVRWLFRVKDTPAARPLDGVPLERLRVWLEEQRLPDGWTPHHETTIGEVVSMVNRMRGAMQRFAKEMPKDVETAGAVPPSVVEAPQTANAIEGEGVTPDVEPKAHPPAALSIVLEHDGESAQDLETLVDGHSVAPSGSADAAPSKRKTPAVDAGSDVTTIPTPAPQDLLPGIQTQIPDSPSVSLPPPADIATSAESTATPACALHALLTSSPATEDLTEHPESDAEADASPRPATPPSPPLPPLRLASPAASSPTTEAAPPTPDAPDFAAPSFALTVQAEDAKGASVVTAGLREVGEDGDEAEEAELGALQPGHAKEGIEVAAPGSPAFADEDLGANAGSDKTSKGDVIIEEDVEPIQDSTPLLEPPTTANDQSTPSSSWDRDTALMPESVHGVQIEADDETTEATTDVGDHSEPGYDSYDAHKDRGHSQTVSWATNSFDTDTLHTPSASSASVETVDPGPLKDVAAASVDEQGEQGEVGANLWW